MIEILTAALVLITGFYAWVTYQIAKTNEKVVSEMQSQTINFNRPYIAIRPLTIAGDQCIYLHISNTGKTSANSVRLEIDRDFFQFARENDDDNLANFNVFQKEIDCFAPGTELNYYLGTGPSIFGHNQAAELSPAEFKIKATYSFLDRIVHETTTIDLRPYLRTVDPAPLVNQLTELIKVIETLNDTLKKRAS